jgi:hypothetical protein
VNADNDQAFCGVLLMPFPQRGNYADAINSAIGPKFNKHHLPPQVGQSKRL